MVGDQEATPIEGGGRRMGVWQSSDTFPSESTAAGPTLTPGGRRLTQHERGVDEPLLPFVKDGDDYRWCASSDQLSSPHPHSESTQAMHYTSNHPHTAHHFAACPPPHMSYPPLSLWGRWRPRGPIRPVHEIFMILQIRRVYRWCEHTRDGCSPVALPGDGEYEYIVMTAGAFYFRGSARLTYDAAGTLLVDAVAAPPPRGSFSGW
jgi:hypothetical protein